MSDARDEIMGRIHNALKNVPEEENPNDVKVPRSYRRSGNMDRHRIVSLFAERVGEYRTTVSRIENGDPGPAIADACRREKVEKLVVPAGFPDEWLPPEIELLADALNEPLSHRELDRSDGVITTCSLAVAETGTIVLDAGEGQGRRALTLVPDYHLCIVKEEQIVELVPEAFAHFGQTVAEEGRPITFISGPSATSDIELDRVEGVHGPRRLEVLIVSALDI